MSQTLSRRRLVQIVLTLAVMVGIVALGFSRQEEAEPVSAAEFTVEMSISEIAPGLGVTGKSLARELGLPLDVPKKEPLRSLSVTRETLDHAVHHLLGHRDTTLKYYVFAAIVFFGLMYLAVLGRPAGSTLKERRSWYPRWPYIGALVAAVAVCGFALGKSPNPMEGAVKVFKGLVGLYPSMGVLLAAFAFFAVLAVVGNKLVCGWACPFGALQELIYHLPILRNIKKRRIPFAVTNSVRAALFMIALLLLFGVVGGRKGFVIYHSLNPFNLFNLDFETAFIAASILVMLVLSFGFYRPFCQFICPFGFLSWFLERLSIFRVKIDRNRCVNCGACIKACPNDAALGRVEGKLFAADCFSCARCLNVCPVDAVKYSLVGSRPHGEADGAESAKE